MQFPNAIGAYRKPSKIAPSPIAPDAPTITLTPGNGQISIAWTDGSNGGSAITGHKLYAGVSADSLALVGTIATASPYLDTGLTNGTPRYYALSAVNLIGEGPRSAVANATPILAGFTSAPAISGTPGVGNVLTATPAGISGGTITGGQWYSQGVAISGATGLTYTQQSSDLLLDVTYRSKAGALTSSASNRIRVTAAALPTYRYLVVDVLRDSEATAPDPTGFWPLAEIAVLDQANARVSGTWTGPLYSSQSVLSDNDFDTFSYVDRWPARLVFDAGAATQFTSVGFGGRNAGGVTKFLPGNFNVYGANSAPSATAGNTTGLTALFQKSGYPDGTENALGYPDVAIKQFPFSSPTGLSVAAVGGLKTLGAQTFAVTVGDASGFGGATQVRVVDTVGGTLISDWAAATATVSLPGGPGYYIDIRNSGQPTKIVRSAAITSRAGHPFVLGQNLGFLYDASMMVNPLKTAGIWNTNDTDHAPYNQVFAGDTFWGLGFDGFPNKMNGSGKDLHINLPAALPASVLGQNWAVTTDPGVTLSLNAYSGGKGLAVVSANPSTGSYVYSVPSDYNTGYTGGAQIAITALPAGGMTRLDVQPSAYSSPSAFTAEFLADLAWAKVIRPMNAAATNSRAINGNYADPANAPTTAGKLSTASGVAWDSSTGMPIDVQIDLCNAVGADLWLTLPAVGDDTLIAYVAGRIAAKLLGKVIIEWANEAPWGTFRASYDLPLLGVKAGFGPPGLANSAAATPLSGNFTLNIDNAQLVKPLATGDYVLLPINSIGNVVMRAKANLAAGTATPTAADFPTGTTANFQLVYGAADSYIAGMRFKVKRSLDMRTALIAAGFPASRIGVAMMDRIGNTVGWTTLLEWDNAWQVTKYLGYATYDLVVDYLSTDYANAPAAMQAATTQAAWTTAFYAMLDAATVTLGASVKNGTDWLADYCISKGLAWNAIAPGYYEGAPDTNPPTGSWPNAPGGLATVMTWWIAARKAAGMQTCTTNWLNAVRDAGGGLNVNFCDVQGIVTSGYPGWGSKEYTGQDSAQTPVWRALNAFV